MKVKKRSIFIGAVIVGVVILGIILAKSLFIPYKNYKMSVCNVAINKDSSTIGKTYDELNSYLQSKASYKIDELDLSEIISYDYSRLIDDLKEQDFSTYRKNKNKDKTYSKDYWDYSIKTAELYDLIKEYNKDKEESVNASYDIKDNKFVLVNEVVGTQIDSQSFVSAITSSLDKYGFLSDELKISDYYIKPEVTDEIMQTTIDDANKYADWYVKYSDGSKYTIDAERDITLTYDNDSFKMEVNNEFLADIVKDVNSKFTTVGSDWDFKTTDGENVKVSGGTWGNQVDKESELAELQELFSKCEVQDNREPVYSSSYTDIGNTYVEVSISKQHVWVYENGNCVMDTDCVTGDAHLSRDTPKGVYYISECIDGKYLTGDNYKTWVNKWMRLTNTGIGLHDAYWRSAFGGSIYKTNGSHGCINLPAKFASDLFEKAYRGMPVIIY